MTVLSVASVAQKFFMLKLSAAKSYLSSLIRLLARANTPQMFDKELGVYLLAYNLVRALMSRAASATHVLVRALSFKGTLKLLLAFQQQVRWAGNRSADKVIGHLLGAISEMILPVRPGRVEPHAIKRKIGRAHV